MSKKIIVAGALTISALGMMAANATTPGFYATGQLGYGLSHFKDDSKMSRVAQLKNGALAGRLGIGYQLNQNFAVEAGYLQLAKQDVKINNVLGVKGFTIKQHAFDVAAKGILPINDKFNAYAKLGAAYLTTAGGIAPVAHKGSTPHRHDWAPEAGLGVSFNVTPNMFIDTSWTHIHPVGKDKLHNVDFAAVGVGYSFG